jgi:acetyl esterase/lipase
MRRRLILATPLALVVTLPLVAQPPTPKKQAAPKAVVPPGVTVVRDLEYARIGDISLKLDLYLPERRGEAPRPLVVWVHGGGWRGGSKENTSALPLLRRDYAVASIGYRLSQVATFPAQIEDCKAAIRWLRAHADEYELDTRRIGVWGASAGGHLVALLGTSGDVKELEGTAGPLDQSSRVQAVVDWFGPTDFTRMSAFPNRIDHDAPNSPESLLLGGPVQDNKDKAARANPITYVTADDPPFLIMHGDQDDLVPSNQSDLLHEALQAANVDVTYLVIKGAGHGFGPNPAVIGAVSEFFDQHVKGTNPSNPRLPRGERPRVPRLSP